MHGLMYTALFTVLLVSWSLLTKLKMPLIQVSRLSSPLMGPLGRMS